jgi:hypothetical protein
LITPLKAGEDSRHNWKTINQVAEANADVFNKTRDQARIIEDLRKRYGDSPVHPFAIYQTGTLKYKVRDGLVIITDAPAIVPTGLETELTSPGGADYWIVCDLTTTTAVVSGTASSPVFSTEKIPIGWIDSEGAIHQFLHDNIFSPCVTTEAPP